MLNKDSKIITMKELFLSLILVLTINFSFAQKSKDCITIIETNLTKQPATVQEIKKLKDKIIISSTKDDKEYYLTISPNNTEEFLGHIDISARISIKPKDDIMYIWIAKKGKEAITVKLFKICI